MIGKYFNNGSILIVINSLLTLLDHNYYLAVHVNIPDRQYELLI